MSRLFGTDGIRGIAVAAIVAYHLGFADGGLLKYNGPFNVRVTGALKVIAIQGSRLSDTASYVAPAFAELVGTALLMFAILGIVDSRSPGDLAGLVIGGAVVAIILIFGPVSGASLNPARAFGPELVSTIAGGATHWMQYVPVYLIPGLVGSAGAALIYDFLAKPRLEQMPIKEAVTHPDEVPAGAPAS